MDGFIIGIQYSCQIKPFVLSLYVCKYVLAVALQSFNGRKPGQTTISRERDIKDSLPQTKWLTAIGKRETGGLRL